MSDAQLLTTSAAYSGTLRFRFESLVMPVTAPPVSQPTVRSEDRENSINTWLAIPVTHILAPGLPRLLMIQHLKN